MLLVIAQRTQIFRNMSRLSRIVREQIKVWKNNKLLHHSLTEEQQFILYDNLLHVESKIFFVKLYLFQKFMELSFLICCFNCCKQFADVVVEKKKKKKKEGKKEKKK
eukprot:TRINITY_DN2245_c0_g1_i4.p4 TRINITY_DN2245_c0_g1~~TRINITY_DN2245_c0_g1_i4.p4  ORF type:complete len:107 (+),score=19.14 TRINITY_DN2245_c0_g1_i4:1209-1529(+)